MLFINIFVLLVSLFSINYNTNDSISSRNSLRSIDTAEEVVHLPVPYAPDEILTNVYFNIDLTVSEVVDILDDIVYVDLDGNNGTYGLYSITNVYSTLTNDDMILIIIHDELVGYQIGVNNALIFSSIENNSYGFPFTGWNPLFISTLNLYGIMLETYQIQQNEKLSNLVSITPFENVVNDDEQQPNINDYNQGYQDGYNAANNTSVFSPDNLNLVFTLPVNYGNSSDIAYWPVDRDIFSNWFSGGSYDFISTSFFNEWLDFYFDTQDPLIDLDEYYTFTIFLDFNSPVSIYDLSFEGFGFSGWAYEYSSSTSSLIWNYAQGSSDREYYFKSPTLTRNEDTPVASLLVKSIYLQFTMKLSTGTSSVSSNVLKFTDTSIDDYYKGFILGQESGFNNGFNAGQQDGLKQGFNDGYTEAEEYYKPQYEYLLEQYNALNDNYNEFLNEEYTLPKLFWSIGSIPFETFKTIWNVDFLRL